MLLFCIACRGSTPSMVTTDCSPWTRLAFSISTPAGM
jgi:hypothetical protein